MPVPAYHVTLQTKQPALTVKALRGQDAPTVTGGYGGWEEIARPGRVALTHWLGRSPYRVSIPLVLDAWPEAGQEDYIQTPAELETIIARLERMATPTGPGGVPPIVEVDGAVPHQDLKWVIENLEWGAAIYARALLPRRYRQEVLVTLLENIADDAIGAAARARNKARANTQKGKKHTGYRTYIVKRGDTLQSIAARQLGSAARWGEIGRLNNIRDPRNLKVGQRLKIPKN